jgi:arabinofuranosyltransferase
MASTTITPHTSSAARVHILQGLLFAPVAAIVAFCYWRVQQDDAYIFYSYARNLISGNGYVFNAGEQVNGTTSPLYTLLLALFGLPLPDTLLLDALPLIGHVIGALSLFAAAWAAVEIYQNERGVSFFFPVLLLLNPLLYHGAGMESYLVIALVLWTFATYLRGNMTLTAIFAALAFLARPDTALATAVVGISFLWRVRRLPPWQAIIAGLVVVAPWLIFSQLYFGELIPLTLSAKMAQTNTGYWGTGLIFLKGIFSTVVWSHLLLGLVWGILFLASLLFLIARDRQRLLSHPSILILSWNLLYLVVYGLIINPPAYPWYYIPLAVGMSLVIALAIASLWAVSKWTWAVGSLAVAGVVALSLTVGYIAWRSDNDKYLNYQAVAQWLNEHANPGDRVASVEIGVLRYYYERGPIIDALGLVDPAIAESITRQEYGWYIQELKPEWILVNNPPRRILEDATKTEWFQSLYDDPIPFVAGKRTHLYRKSIQE